MPLPQVGRGARICADGAVEFTVWAPFAERVSVELEEGRRSVDLELGARGEHRAVVADVAPGSSYMFRLDSSDPLPDPVSRHQPQGVHGPSAVVDPTAYAWSDAGWAGIELADLVFYELHVGTFTEAGTFDAAIDVLPALRGLGITAIELMPVAQFPGSRNWGYDGVFPYAPQNTYGGPDALRRLVDAAHAIGLAVFLDVVYNHIGPEGNVLGRYGPYFTDRYRTPWGDAVNFDGAGSDDVRRYFVDNALHWISEYHLDGLRLDAVHAICDLSARPFLAELGDAAHELAAELGRRVHLVAESDANDPRLVSSGEHGGIGLDGVWNDDYHHAVHSALTGERDGYYADFGASEAIAKAFNDRFVYDGQYSAHRQRRHGAPAPGLGSERFVVCVQNHDQIGNRARGERLAALVEPARLRLAAALLLLSPFVPLLFMGEEYGETRPFLYFVDHGDEELQRAVREGRRREFAAFGWRGEVPDPTSPDTFAASRLLRPDADAAPNAGLQALYTELLRLRRDEPALRPGGAEAVATGPRPGTVQLRLTHPSSSLLVLFQIGESEDELEIAPRGTWQLCLDTEAPAFGGTGIRAPQQLEGGASVRLSADAAWLYRKAT